MLLLCCIDVVIVCKVGFVIGVKLGKIDLMVLVGD